MTMIFSEADERFRQDVRSFLKAELTDDLREAGRRCTGIYCDHGPANAWHRILAAKGWSVPHWPVEYGGTGWTPLQHYVFECELAAAGAPARTPNATHMVAPVIMAFGTDTQKAELLPRIRSGEDWWAQGYSEPGAGSDLASLRCAAGRDGDGYVINGSKIWTTHAHFSNRIFCLVRTRPDGKPQAGISFLLFDLDLPGITIRPIISISGDHELNEIFFDNVRVPVSALLGAENDGWTVAKYLLQHERSHNWSPLLRSRLNRLRDQAAATPGGSMLDDPVFAARLSRIDIAITTLEISELRILTGDIAGEAAAIIPSIMKVRGTELRQQLTELALDVAGRAAAIGPGAALAPGYEEAADAMSIYLNDRAASIYAGTNEIQRNIIGASLLR